MKPNIAKMRASGIPDEALATTLVTLGHESLRTMLKDGELSGKSGVMLFLQPYTPNASGAYDVDLVLYTLAKEASITGAEVYCMAFSDIVALMSEAPIFDDPQRMWDRINKVEMLFVTGVAEVGDCYYREDIKRFAASLFLKRVRTGGKLVLSSHSTMAGLTLWWPSNFVGYVERKATIVTVGGEQ